MWDGILRFNQLPNDGYISDTLSKALFDNLLKEALVCEHTIEKHFTGIDNNLTWPHYQVSEKNIEDLVTFLIPYIEEFDSSNN